MATVLVVDDSPVDRRLVSGILRKDESLEVECSENGAQALQSMQVRVPELVLTDMQMPDMNGLELVVNSRMQFPEVPIVLMTAHGSEELAVEALEQGAASYVPKTQIASKLLDTVEEVLSCSRAVKTSARLASCQTLAHSIHELMSDDAMIDPLVESMQDTIQSMELIEFNDCVRLGVALKECLINALYRGNLQLDDDQMRLAREKPRSEASRKFIADRCGQSPYHDRKVTVEATLESTRIRFRIQDDGPGFDHECLKSSGDSSTLEAERGRGMWLIQSFMDEVHFNEKGNEITLVKYVKTPNSNACR